MVAPAKPSALGQTLERVLKRIDPDKRLEVYRVWTFWAEEVGEAIAARAEPAGFRAGILSVRVSSASWTQELQFMKETLRERLNARLGKELIRDIYFVSGSMTRRQAEPAEEAVASKPIAVPLLPHMQNPELAAVFRRLVRAHARRPSQADPATKKSRTTGRDE
jgi:predicted nucleic acid-binding Zn ribbon protein